MQAKAYWNMFALYGVLPFLAHGALGYWDEAIFITVMVIFFGLMALSWVRSRSLDPEFDDETADFRQKRKNDHSPHEASDRFRLD